jgi:putative peptidoglycan lipid II flippase
LSGSRLARSAGLISLATLTSRVLGVGRETVLAYYFGASASMQMDAYNVAFRIPNLVRDLFAEGAITAALVPQFTRTLAAQGQQAVFRLGNLVMNGLLLAAVLVVMAGVVLAGPITALLAPEFAAVPGKLQLTTDLTRVMLPFLATIAAAATMMGLLNAHHRFFVPALSPALFNIATILCAVTLVPVMPQIGLAPIMAIAVGTLLGGMAQVAVQWPALRSEGFRYVPMLDLRDAELRRILRAMIPGTLGVAALNINVLVDTYMATGQEQGAVSWLAFAYRLMYLPLGLVGVSVATAALPDVARFAASADLASVRRTVSSALRLMLMLNVPATVGLLALATPIVALLYERGLFTTTDTAATAAALVCYAPGLVGYSAVKIASPTFYALQDSRTPVVIALLAVTLNVVLNLALLDVMGHAGLALATAVASLFNAATLLALLRRRLEGLDERRVLVGLTKIILASMAMGAAAWATATWLDRALPGDGELQKATRVIVAILAGLVTLGAAARTLRIDEFSDAAMTVMRRLTPPSR